MLGYLGLVLRRWHLHDLAADRAELLDGASSGSEAVVYDLSIGGLVGSSRSR